MLLPVSSLYLNLVPDLLTPRAWKEAAASCLKVLATILLPAAVALDVD